MPDSKKSKLKPALLQRLLGRHRSSSSASAPKVHPIHANPNLHPPRVPPWQPRPLPVGPSSFPLHGAPPPPPLTTAPPTQTHSLETHLPSGRARIPSYVPPPPPSAASYVSTLAHLVRAELALDTLDLPLALELYTSTPACPHFSRAHLLFNAAAIHLQLFALAEARACLQQAVALDPCFVVGWHQLGGVCMLLRRWRDAEDAFEIALEKMKTRETCAYNMLGLAYRVKRDEVLWNRGAAKVGREWVGRVAMVPMGAVFRVEPGMAARRSRGVGGEEWAFAGRGRVVGASDSWFDGRPVGRQESW
ncbi:hypothetical protein EDC01DRAFT_730685 [Geopyxis carbonaria]|nr:hypothetical protein EDC01DRAFT_730685 [Geopyxis carbonaria]